MKKEEMIKQILRSLESDFFKIKRCERNTALKTEWQRLNLKTYSEIELLYYSVT